MNGGLTYETGKSIRQFVSNDSIFFQQLFLIDFSGLQLGFRWEIRLNQQPAVKQGNSSRYRILTSSFKAS